MDLNTSYQSRFKQPTLDSKQKLALLIHVGRRLVHREKLIGQRHHPVRVAGKRGGIRGAGNVSAQRRVLRLGLRDGNRRPHTHETEKFRCDIFVHPQTPSRCRKRLHPTRVKTVGRFEFTPIRHRGAFESPPRWFVLQIAPTHRIPIDGITMGIRPVVVVFRLNPKAASRCRRRTFPHRHRHHQKRSSPFHHIGHAIGQRDLDPDIRWI